MTVFSLRGFSILFLCGIVCSACSPGDPEPHGEFVFASDEFAGLLSIVTTPDKRVQGKIEVCALVDDEAKYTSAAVSGAAGEAKLTFKLDTDHTILQSETVTGSFDKQQVTLRFSDPRLPASITFKKSDAALFDGARERLRRRADALKAYKLVGHISKEAAKIVTLRQAFVKIRALAESQMTEYESDRKKAEEFANSQRHISSPAIDRATHNLAIDLSKIVDRSYETWINAVPPNYTEDTARDIVLVSEICGTPPDFLKLDESSDLKQKCAIISEVIQELKEGFSQALDFSFQLKQSHERASEAYKRAISHTAFGIE